MISPAQTSVARWFVAVIVVSIPIWFAGAVIDWRPFPGVPVSAAMAFVPGLVAIAFIANATGAAGALQWLRSTLHAGAANRGLWLLVAALLPPAIMIATYLVMLVLGYDMPKPGLRAGQLATLLLIFMVPGLLEEIGWSGYAIDSLQRRMSALKASLIVGVVWSAWHFIPLSQVGRSAEWIAMWTLGTIALRVLITWVYNSSAHSVLAAALAHASENASWQAFPNNGSHYDPAVHAVVLVIACGLIVAVSGGTLRAYRSLVS